jgi:hypothetical protein
MAAKKNGGPQGPGGITKWDAVRQALEAMGGDAKPLAIQAYLKDHLGMEVKTNLISVYKKDLAKKAGKKKRAKMPAAARKDGAGDQALVQPKPAAPGGILLEDILAVRNLVNRLGAAPLHTLIDAFAK